MSVFKSFNSTDPLTSKMTKKLILTYVCTNIHTTDFSKV